MNDTQLLERLSSAYATLEAPAPSAALAEILESGAVGGGTDDERRDAVVIPLVRPQTQTRLRMRHLVAAMVATFVLFSGLAVAGALPDAVQRQVSSVVSHLGIDLPSPDSGPTHDSTDSPRSNDRQGPTATSGPSAGAGTGTATTVVGDGTGAPAAGGGASRPGSPSTTTPGGLPLGSVGDVGGAAGGTVTTLPPSGGDPLLPSVTLPQITLPPITLPPITLPQITLPPLTLPQLPLPLPLDLPLFGL